MATVPTSAFEAPTYTEEAVGKASVQYNKNGNDLGGDPFFTYNPLTKTLSVPVIETAPAVASFSKYGGFKTNSIIRLNNAGVLLVEQAAPVGQPCFNPSEIPSTVFTLDNTYASTEGGSSLINGGTAFLNNSNFGTDSLLLNGPAYIGAGAYIASTDIFRTSVWTNFQTLPPFDGHGPVFLAVLYNDNISILLEIVNTIGYQSIQTTLKLDGVTTTKVSDIELFSNTWTYISVSLGASGVSLHVNDQELVITESPDLAYRFFGQDITFRAGVSPLTGEANVNLNVLLSDLRFDYSYFSSVPTTRVIPTAQPMHRASIPFNYDDMFNDASRGLEYDAATNTLYVDNIVVKTAVQVIP